MPLLLSNSINWVVTTLLVMGAPRVMAVGTRWEKDPHLPQM